MILKGHWNFFVVGQLNGLCWWSHIRMTLMVGWLFVLWCINPFWVVYHRIKFQTIQLSITIVFVYKQLNVKTVLFQII